MLPTSASAVANRSVPVAPDQPMTPEYSRSLRRVERLGRTCVKSRLNLWHRSHVPVDIAPPTIVGRAGKRPAGANAVGPFDS